MFVQELYKNISRHFNVLEKIQEQFKNIFSYRMF